jgi:hypothetical protein
MSIEQSGGMFIPVCDVCCDELPAEFDFVNAVQAKKNAGWKSRKVNGDWEDWCDACLAEESQRRINNAFGTDDKQ